nr:hypothetical protein [Candidatus Coxiella mudrowiae]
MNEARRCFSALLRAKEQEIIFTLRVGGQGKCQFIG